MENINYSIIIPHKNIPKLLCRCLDSIPKREDIQIIVVDDNSAPEIVDFDNFPGRETPNVEIYFDKSGMGAGRARNIGLQHAVGKWLLFADADDFFNYCINDLLDDYKESSSDIIFFDSNSVESETYLTGKRGIYTHFMIKMYDENPKRAEFLLRYYLGVPWSKIIRRSLVEDNKCLFDETPINNDTTFAYTIGIVARSISVDKRAGYCITNRSDSISYTLTDEKILASIDVFSRKYKALKEKKIDVYEGFIPMHMKRLQREGKKELYEKCLGIMGKYGLNESMIYKSFWNPPFVENIEDMRDFCFSDFGKIMMRIFKKKGLLFKILNKALYLGLKTKKYYDKNI